MAKKWGWLGKAADHHLILTVKYSRQYFAPENIPAKLRVPKQAEMNTTICGIS
jgi:hypothetical protein